MPNGFYDAEWATTEKWAPRAPRGRKGLSKKQLGVLLGLAAAATGAVIYANRKPRRPRAIPGKTMPRGKGVFIRSLTRLGTPTQVAELVKSMDLDYVLIHTIWQHSRSDMNTFNVEHIAEYARAFRRQGIRVWLWGYPDKGAIDLFVDTMAGAARLADADGFIVDAEGGVYSASNEQARQLTEGLRKASGGRPVGLSTYPWPPFHPPVPYKAYAKYADFGAPMIYDKDRRHTDADYRRFMKTWEQLGFAGVMPVWGASPQTTVEEMRAISSGTPVPDGTVAWWDLLHLKGRPDAQAFVRQYRIPRAVA